MTAWPPISSHRTDAQSAFGRPHPVDSPLARDAIDGLLTWFVPRMRPASLLPCSAKILHFVEIDGPGHWHLRIDDAEAVVEPVTGQPDVIVRGSASDLLLGLWQRAPFTDLDVEGERALIERYRELVPLP